MLPYLLTVAPGFHRSLVDLPVNVIHDEAHYFINWMEAGPRSEPARLPNDQFIPANDGHKDVAEMASFH